MSAIEIPCVLMRGGTSKGPYIDLADLPPDREARDRVLLRIMGSPDARQIDGLGGADTLTSKVALVGVSERPGIDVDYLFAQVSIERPFVDTEPPCGNMLSGVGPFAIERGMVAATDPTTRVRIFNVNANAVIEAVVQTPDGTVTYDGTTSIDGVPGQAAPVVLNFSDVVGGKTGSLLPTGNVRDVIEGTEVSCIDAGMPMVIVRADTLRLSGGEDGAFFAANSELMARIESMRRAAGARMGMGDVRDTVVPKVGIVSGPVAGGTIRSRYLTPHALHKAHAVTGGICVATAACMPGCVGHEVSEVSGSPSERVVIEHPSGTLEVRLEIAENDEGWTVAAAGVVRTARKIMSGQVFVSEEDWNGR
jgi:2-methylaconitate cis-trans-isomerase PrpF